jgi:2-polyprenyl-3-methyl-5-hydroxy-6-metoxy-1,4-benzoquinol methylase
MENRPIFEAWERLAESFAARVETKAHNAFYDRPAVLSLLPQVTGKRVLDAGCGPGVYAQWLVDQGAEVVGIDSSPKMVEFAQKRLAGRALFVQADLGQPLDFLESASFDVVISALVLDFVEEWTSLFKEFFVCCASLVILFFRGPSGRRVFRASPWKVTYFDIEQVDLDWRALGVEVNVPYYRHLSAP